MTKTRSSLFLMNDKQLDAPKTKCTILTYFAQLKNKYNSQNNPLVLLDNSDNYWMLFPCIPRISSLYYLLDIIDTYTSLIHPIQYSMKNSLSWVMTANFSNCSETNWAVTAKIWFDFPHSIFFHFQLAVNTSLWSFKCLSQICILSFKIGVVSKSGTRQAPD